MLRRVSLAASFVLAVSAVPALAADAPAAGGKPVIAKVCTNCHKAEAGSLRGTFDGVAFKSKSIQLRLDDAVEVVRFDPATLKVTNGEKSEPAEFLRSVKKGHEVRIAWVEKDGVKTATALSLKQPMSVPAELLVRTADVEKLVAQGPEKGKYTLIDSRPLMRYQEGYIPTAKNLPYPTFDKMVDRLPADKAALLVFYCGGPTCSMSPKSAEKAKALGYTNVKVYHEGMPAWSAAHPASLTPQFLKEAWLDKEIPLVLLDARPAAEAGAAFIRGAAVLGSGPVDASLAALKLPAPQKKAPIVVYDGGTGDLAAGLARKLIASGQTGVRLLEGGLSSWQSAKYPVEKGSPATSVAWAPKARAGEIPWDEFAAIAKGVPPGTVLLDVRPESEAKAGAVRGARNISADEIEKRAGELSPDSRIVIYCATGVQAEMVYYVLKDRGFRNVSWINATLAIDPSGSVSKAPTS